VRILVLQNIAQWTGAIDEQIFLEIPPDMDMRAEETAWFAAGGGTPSDFANHLKTKGARELEGVETWIINYQ